MMKPSDGIFEVVVAGEGAGINTADISIRTLDGGMVTMVLRI